MHLTHACRELLREGDRRLDDQFLELERRQLEKSLRATPSATEGGSNLDTGPPARPAEDAAAEQERREAERREEHAQAAGKVTVAEWVTMGQNSLMDGALADLADAFEPQYDGAVVLLGGGCLMRGLRHAARVLRVGCACAANALLCCGVACGCCVPCQFYSRFFRAKAYNERMRSRLTGTSPQSELGNAIDA